MYDLDYRSWSPWIWWLHAFGLYALVGFFWFWFRFHSLERAAREGMPKAVERYNRALRGFPNAVYAKMTAKRPRDPAPSQGQPGEAGDGRQG